MASINNHNVSNQSEQLDTNTSSIDRGSWTAIVYKDSGVSSQSATSNW